MNNNFSHVFRFNIFIIIILSFAEYLQAEVSQINRYSLSSITMRDGLPHIFVDDIIKDSRGYLWISTSGGGVSRYDGNEFVTFSTNTHNCKLKSNFVSHLCEDKFGRMWIAGENGIDVVSIKYLNLISVLQKGDDKGLFDSSVDGMIISKSGNIWICSDGFLYKISFDNNGNISSIAQISEINVN